MILSPVPTGDLVEVPYYPGHCYAAFLGKSPTQVSMLMKCTKCNIFIKVQSVTLYRERPDFLLYHICSFHILDMKVHSHIRKYLLNHINYNIRYYSTLIYHLELWMKFSLT